MNIICSESKSQWAHISWSCQYWTL